MSKRIELIIDDDVYRDLKNQIFVRGMTGSFFGTADVFTKRLIDHIEQGDEVWEVHYQKQEGKCSPKQEPSN